MMKTSSSQSWCTKSLLRLCLLAILIFIVFVYYFNHVEDRNVKSRKAVKKIPPCKLLSSPQLSPQQQEAVTAKRLKVQKDMEGYNFTELGLGSDTKLEDLVLERCGQPIKTLVLATWRSGSSFTASLLSYHPAMYYEYEPLVYLMEVQVHGGTVRNEALQVVEGMLACNYSNVPHFRAIMSRMAGGTIVQQFYYQRSVLWKDPTFFTAMCRLSPFLLIKTVRLRLSVGKELLRKDIHNFRILHLVRDPRAILQSREHRTWCKVAPDCNDPKRLCMEMEKDFKHAEIVRREYPDRYLVLRYEDISLHPDTAARKIYKFLRLQFHPLVEDFVREHTTKYPRGFRQNGPEDSTLARDSRNHTFYWKDHLYKWNFSRVLGIQTACSKAMELWGYPKFTEREQLSNSSFVPLSSPPWPEMVISYRKKPDA